MVPVNSSLTSHTSDAKGKKKKNKNQVTGEQWTYTVMRVISQEFLVGFYMLSVADGYPTVTAFYMLMFGGDGGEVHDTICTELGNILLACSEGSVLHAETSGHTKA